jgi:hypothetical protein
MNGMRQEGQPSRFTEADLIGAWECFQGDGIHGRDPRVLVFRREADQLFVDHWLPKDGDPPGELRLWATCTGDCAPTHFGLRLQLKCRRLQRKSRASAAASQGEQTLDIQPHEDGTFVLFRPHTSAGGFHFRRTSRKPGPPGRR